MKQFSLEEDHLTTYPLENPGRSRYRSPLNRSPKMLKSFKHLPPHPVPFYNVSPFKPPPNSHSPQHDFHPLCIHGWDDSTKREVYLKSDSDFNNPNGFMYSLVVFGSFEACDVVVFPSKQLGKG